ncbi:MAG: dihydropteroate synthase [Vicinamibacterales bacterium]
MRTRRSARLRPLLRAIGGRARVPLSIDTTKAAVANFALDEGVAMVNDISGLDYDPGMGPLVAARGVPLVLMHMRGRPGTICAEARYEDVVSDVMRDLGRRIEHAVGCGIAWDRLLVDPGIGFAKQAEHSYRVLAGLDRLQALGRPLLVGPSRKSFLTAATGDLPADARDWPTAAAVTAAVLAAPTSSASTACRRWCRWCAWPMPCVTSSPEAAARPLPGGWLLR